jgi:hypothetical protein
LTDELAWPEDRIPLDTMRAWLSAKLPGSPVIAPEVTTLRVKRWGATGVFRADGERVVGKHAEPPLFPTGPAVHRFVEDVAPHAVAPLLAVEDGPGWQRTAYGFVSGPTADTCGAGCRPSVARALAAIQVSCAGRPAPGLPVYHLPTVVDTLVADVREAGDQAPQLAARLFAAHDALRVLAAELVAAVPVSIDHSDMNPDNAIVADGAPVVILDWEEASIGCPLLSLSRLLQDANGSENAIIDAYRQGVDAWGDTGELIVAANIVAPVKIAAESRAFARVLGWPPPYNNHPRYTARLLTTALDRFDALQRRHRP